MKGAARMCKGKDQALNSRQRQLVEEHLSVVDWVLKDYIKVNEHVVGLGREDQPPAHSAVAGRASFPVLV